MWGKHAPLSCKSPWHALLLFHARPSALAGLHMALLLLGLASGTGHVPGLAVAVGTVSLALPAMLHLPSAWHRERPWVMPCCREVVLAMLAVYADSVAVYMVAVLNGRRDENLELQDNLRMALAALCRASPGFEAALLTFPELYAEEAIAYAITLALLSSRREGGVPFFASLAKLAQALRWCRLLRVACFTSTVLPSQTPDCFLNRYDETYSTEEHWAQALTHWRAGGGCNDLIFSGHFVVLGLSALLHSSLCNGSFLSTLLWIRMVHAGLRIVYGHFHMSVDLIVSAVVTCLLWRALPLPHGAATRQECARGSALPATPWAAWLSLDRHGQRWCVAVLLTALLSLGLATAGGRYQPLSSYNRQRLELVSPGSQLTPRLFCAVLHIERGAAARQGYASVVAETWGRRCDGLLLWDELRADVAPFAASAAQQEPAPDGLRANRWLRARRMWRHIGKEELAKYDWFVSVDDGGFVVPENVRRVLTVLDETPGAHFLAGGGSWAPWGYILNRAAVQELLLAMDGHIVAGAPPHACPWPSSAVGLVAEYEPLHDCLRRARGVESLAWEAVPRLREVMGCAEGDVPVVNLKVREAGSPCRHAVLAYMVPTPSWVHEIFEVVYGENRSSLRRTRLRT